MATRHRDPALRQEPRADGKDADADREVDEEDPRPAQVRGEDAAEQHADGAADAGDRAPHRERDIPVVSLTEGRDDDRERRRCEQCAAEPLQCPREDQLAFRRGEPGQQRGEREQPHPCHEHAPATEQVGETAAQQERAAEEDRVGGDHPLQALLREVQVVLDRRQRDVHHRDVEDDHELRGGGDRQDEPAAHSRATPAFAAGTFENTDLVSHLCFLLNVVSPLATNEPRPTGQRLGLEGGRTAGRPPVRGGRPATPLGQWLGCGARLGAFRSAAPIAE